MYSCHTKPGRFKATLMFEEQEITLSHINDHDSVGSLGASFTVGRR
jgi:hypothetical protein